MAEFARTVVPLLGPICYSVRGVPLRCDTTCGNSGAELWQLETEFINSRTERQFACSRFRR